MCIIKTGIWSVKMLPQKWQLLSTTRWQLGIKTVVEMPAYGRWESCISSENFWSIIRLHCLLGINAFLMLSQVLTYNGFYDSNLEFVSLDNVQIVASMNSGNSLGRHQLTSRFTSIVRLCSIGYALSCICFTFSDFVMQKKLFILGFLTCPSVLWHCWLGVMKSIRPVQIEWWGVGVVICLEQGGVCLHMV